MPTLCNYLELASASGGLEEERFAELSSIAQMRTPLSNTARSPLKFPET